MNNNLPLSVKRKVYTQRIPAVPLYGLEIWHVTKVKKNTQRGMERKHLYFIWKYRTPGRQTTELPKFEDIFTMTKKKNWIWAGHIMSKTNIK